jgi:hypothetical protein
LIRVMNIVIRKNLSNMARFDNMFVELDIFVLKRDIQDYKLKAGDVGAVVLAYAATEYYEVDSVNVRGWKNPWCERS